MPTGADGSGAEGRAGHSSTDRAGHSGTDGAGRSSTVGAGRSSTDGAGGSRACPGARCPARGHVLASTRMKVLVNVALTWVVLAPARYIPVMVWAPGVRP